MVNQIINATYTETYDINTAVNELTLLGIHTPLAKNMKAQFKGFFEQYKKVKILGCDIALACASTQALDPTQLGIGSGAMDPRDVMNPILFKACTGEKMNVLLDRIYNTAATEADDGSLKQSFQTGNDVLNAYYSLLSDDSFRKTHPQSGLTVMGLKPLVRKIVTTSEFKFQGSESTGGPWLNNNLAYDFGGDAISNTGTSTTTPNIFMTNGTVDMPAIETAFEDTVNTQVVNGTTVTNQQITKQWLINSIPRIYMGVIVLPPAIVQKLFFRMSIRWHVQFLGYRPCLDLAPLSGYNGVERTDGLHNQDNWGYFNLYHNATPNSKVMNTDYGSFTTNEVTEVTKIMEKGQ